MAEIKGCTTCTHRKEPDSYFCRSCKTSQNHYFYSKDKSVQPEDFLSELLQAIGHKPPPKAVALIAPNSADTPKEELFCVYKNLHTLFSVALDMLEQMPSFKAFFHDKERKDNFPS